MYLYVCIDIYREREREREVPLKGTSPLEKHMHTAAAQPVIPRFRMLCRRDALFSTYSSLPYRCCKKNDNT